VFENGAALLGSALKAGGGNLRRGSIAAARFHETRPFSYASRRRDALHSDRRFTTRGSSAHFYRIKVGKLPVALSAYPLGVRARQDGADFRARIQSGGQGRGEGRGFAEEERAIPAFGRMDGGTFVQSRQACLGGRSGVESAGANASLATAQAVNARLRSTESSRRRKGYFRFHATGRKACGGGEREPAGLALDSMIEFWMPRASRSSARRSVSARTSTRCATTIRCLRAYAFCRRQASRWAITS